MRRRIGILLAAAVGATWLLAAPASADDTTVTFTVTTGAIDISAPTGPVALTNGTLTPGGTASGQIGTVDVTDARGVTPAAWDATVSSTTWSGPAVPPIPSTAASYSAGPVTAAGAGLCAAAVGGPIPTTPTTTTAVSHTGGGGGNTCSWDPTISVAIPVTAATVTYTAIVQHLVVGL